MSSAYVARAYIGLLATALPHSTKFPFCEALDEVCVCYFLTSLLLYIQPSTCFVILVFCFFYSLLFSLILFVSHSSSLTKLFAHTGKCTFVSLSFSLSFGSLFRPLSLWRNSASLLLSSLSRSLLMTAWAAWVDSFSSSRGPLGIYIAASL